MEILIVDDAPDSLDFISTVLKSVGHSIIEAVDGESAISLFENTNCSIVLLDWMLPDLSGIDVANRIKQLRYAYVIMVTALSQRENGEEALNAGARDYIEKPFDIDELTEAVDLAVAVVTAREKYFARLKKRGVAIEMIEEFA